MCGVLARQPPDRRGDGRSEESGEPSCGSSPAAQRDSGGQNESNGHFSLYSIISH